MANLNSTQINGSLKVTDTIYGNLSGNATTSSSCSGNSTTATALSSTIANDKLPRRLQESNNDMLDVSTINLAGFYHVRNSSDPNGTYAPPASVGNTVHGNVTDATCLCMTYDKNWRTFLAQDFRTGTLFINSRVQTAETDTIYGNSKTFSVGMSTWKRVIDTREVELRMSAQMLFNSSTQSIDFTFV